MTPKHWPGVRDIAGGQVWRRLETAGPSTSYWVGPVWRRLFFSGPAEDLIVTKVLAGRPKDLDDVRGILRAREGRVNLQSVRDLLAMLEDALGVSHLVPVFESLLDSRQLDRIVLEGTCPFPRVAATLTRFRAPDGYLSLLLR